MSVLARRLTAIDDALSQAGLPHAFGGAIALAYCTEEPRGTRDLDVNVFVDPDAAEQVLTALPEEVTSTAADAARLRRDGQVRVWWEDTPIDLFLNVHAFHQQVAVGVRQVPFAGRRIPVLGCDELAVFKALIGRTKDWADIEAMIERGSIEAAETAGRLERIVGAEHPATLRLAELRPA
jgi:hypothetical protein